MAKFPFSDLHNFKDYVIFVGMCAPNQFPVRDGRAPEDQWSLELAFKGLREGLVYFPQGHKARDECQQLFDEAYELYKQLDRKNAFFKVEEVSKILRSIPTR